MPAVLFYRQAGLRRFSGPPGPGRPQQGSIFIFSLMSLLVLMILGTLSVQTAIQSVNRASREKDAAQAFNLAESGADAAEAWLRAQSYPPLTEHTIAPVSLGNGNYQAKIVPDTGNSGAWQKSYTIYGKGRIKGDTVSRQVVMRVRAESFAFYAYFTDEERSPITDDEIWFFSRDRVYGPAHSNDTIHIDWDATSADPIFYGTVSTAKSSIAWSPRAPGNQNEWRRVLDGGQDALTLGTDDIPLPDSTEEQKLAAWGASTGFPSDDGVYLPTTGTTLSAGIYIRGDSTVEFAVNNANGNQIIYITQGSGSAAKTTTLTVDLAGNRTTVVDKNGATTIYSGITNGVMYTTGHITSLKGMLANNYEDGSAILRRNAWTIATDVNAGKDVTITDNLQYKTPPDADLPASHTSNLRAATLGVVAEDIILASSTPTEMTINGVMLAGGENTANGSFYNSDYAGKKKNNLNILGGVIQKKRGPVGTFSQSSNTLQTGYNKNYRYDTRMVDSPPPFFPTTGQFDILSWQYL